MFELFALLMSAFVLFMFGVSVMSLMVIAAIMILSFILISTLSFIFKFGFWILLAYLIYYYFFQYNKDKS
ncbi:hypothetical protein [Psychromonas algicola]|uniref:hypothetical protein n=1 Tax=Psychromonas algicola TaxID=2555642 RepID=UPI0010672157|nr:hypothetical protein [Psychromonas sp. RZ5]TEW49015.1 hypothetical protein E2R67_11260 [Psychromonas sp. RZ5]